MGLWRSYDTHVTSLSFPSNIEDYTLSPLSNVRRAAYLLFWIAFPSRAPRRIPHPLWCKARRRCLPNIPSLRHCHKSVSSFLQDSFPSFYLERCKKRISTQKPLQFVATPCSGRSGWCSHILLTPFDSPSLSGCVWSHNVPCSGTFFIKLLLSPSQFLYNHNTSTSNLGVSPLRTESYYAMS